MGDDYERKLQAMRAKIQVAEGDPFSIEKELTALVNEGGPNLAKDLLLSLSDEAHSGAMYALVHAAESLDQNPYRLHISAVVSILPQLFRNSPNWTLELLRRMMGAEATLRELTWQLSEAAAPIKEAARRICMLNDAVVPDYISATVKAEVVRAAS